MSHAPIFPTGGFLSANHSSHATAARVDELGRAPDRSRGARRELRLDPSDPLADETRYAAWKVTLFVIVFCAAFWGGIAYLAMRLFG
ncbi:MAG: hypothetical protein Q8R02_11490 [Hyphomonadaceae bacterium]|nr:hypothetical protein [Hyphomonadaceae bacterium]